jgi:UDP-galactopyranose mutase
MIATIPQACSSTPTGHTTSALVRPWFGPISASLPLGSTLNIAFFRTPTVPFGNSRSTSTRSNNSSGAPPHRRRCARPLARWRIPIEQPINSEELILSRVGRELYEKFFRNYTRKQWGLDPKDLDPAVCGRIPIRVNRDNRYLTERFQALPQEGYTPLFQRLLDHPNIEVRLGVSFQNPNHGITYKRLVYTGPVDAYYNYRFGVLPYRSLRFETETLEQEYYQPVVQVNYPNNFEFTRIIEAKHITGQKLPRTTIIREYPQAFTLGREAYYPIPNPAAHAQFARYARMMGAEKDVSFVGRLATYRYYNMDQVIASALAEFTRLTGIRPAFSRR